MAAAYMPTPVHYAGRLMYFAEELKAYAPAYFYGCARTVRKIIQRKSIPQSYYKFVKEKNGALQPSVETYNRSKLLLDATWAQHNVFRYAPASVRKNAAFCPCLLSEAAALPLPATITTSACDDNDDDDMDVDDDDAAAPPVLHLNDHDKFKDLTGKPLQIEIRGLRTPSGCYFLLRDVLDGFGITSVVTRREGYVKGTHYRTFISSSSSSGARRVFLTYKGIMRLLSELHIPMLVLRFQDWATTKLFTSYPQHRQTAPAPAPPAVVDALGTHARVMQDVFKADVSAVACVYLFTLGTVDELRDVLGIDASVPGQAVVCKFGNTNDLVRRTADHLNDYGKIPRVVLKIKHYAAVDPKFVVEAEGDLRTFFAKLGMRMEIKGRRELVAVLPDAMESIKRQYVLIQSAHAGRNNELIERVKDLEQKLAAKDQEIALMVSKHENALLRTEYERDMSLADKDREISVIKQRLMRAEYHMMTQQETTA